MHDLSKGRHLFVEVHLVKAFLWQIVNELLMTRVTNYTKPILLS